jgi:nitroreductase
MSPVEQKIGSRAAASIARSEAVDDVIKRRFANRAFTDDPVPRRTVEAILEVARFTPSGANIQPWRVYVLGGAEKEAISGALLRSHNEARDQHVSEYRYYASELPEPYLSRRDQFGRLFYGSLGIAQTDVAARSGQTSKNYGFFGAPIGLIITIDRRLEIGSWLDLGMFVQNVMIAAEARGLQTCPQETFAKYHVVLRKYLPISDDEMVVCGMSIGVAEEASASAGSLMPKVPVNEFAKFIGFDD